MSFSSFSLSYRVSLIYLPAKLRNLLENESRNSHSNSQTIWLPNQNKKAKRNERKILWIYCNTIIYASLTCKFCGYSLIMLTLDNLLAWIPTFECSDHLTKRNRTLPLAFHQLEQKEIKADTGETLLFEQKLQPVVWKHVAMKFNPSHDTFNYFLYITPVNIQQVNSASKRPPPPYSVVAIYRLLTI